MRSGRWRWPRVPGRGAALAGGAQPGQRYSALSRMVALRLAEIKPLPILASLLLVALTTGALLLLHRVLEIESVASAFLVPVLFCAMRWGLVPAMTATLAGVAAADFFFYPPLYTFDISDPRDIIDLVLFSCVAVVTSELAVRLRDAAEAATRREGEVRDLYAFSRQLAACTRPADIYAAIRDYLSNSLGSRAILVGGAENPADEVDVPNEVRQAAMDAFAQHGRETRTIRDARSRHTWLVRPVSFEGSDFGIIAIDLGTGSSRGVDVVKQRIAGILADAATTLARLDVVRLIDAAGQRAQTELLRKALLGSVSHELRTPLASIVGASTILGDAPSIRRDPRLSALLDVLHEEAGRLNDDIQNLLDATRITNENIRAQAEWVDPADIVNAAIERRRQRLAGRSVDLDMADDLPLVKVEARLVEQAFAQILDNALKYSPAGTSIAIGAAANGKGVVLSVHDDGIGLTSDELHRLWERSFRGARHPDVPGSGLGLWIARAFVVANGGSVDAVSAGPGRGTTVSVTLPIAAGAVPAIDEAYDA